MGILDVTEAVKLVGHPVMFELVFDDGSGGKDVMWSFCFVAGVVLGLEGVYPHPHFCVYYMESKTDRYPEQVFFEDIRSYVIVPEAKDKPLKPVRSISLVSS
jgi:hypothetical protein